MAEKKIWRIEYSPHFIDFVIAKEPEGALKYARGAAAARTSSERNTPGAVPYTIVGVQFHLTADETFD